MLWIFQVDANIKNTILLLPTLKYSNVKNNLETTWLFACRYTKYINFEISCFSANEISKYSQKQVDIKIEQCMNKNDLKVLDWISYKNFRYKVTPIWIRNIYLIVNFIIRILIRLYTFFYLCLHIQIEAFSHERKSWIFFECFAVFKFWKYGYTVLLFLKMYKLFENTTIHIRKTFVSYLLLIVHALIYCNTF